jgi:hypothetical protein
MALLKRPLYPTQREVLQVLRPTEPQNSEQLHAQLTVSMTAVQNAVRLLVRWEYAAATRVGHGNWYTLTPLGQRKLALELKAHAGC